MHRFEHAISSPSQQSLPASLHRGPAEVTLIMSIKPLHLLGNPFKKMILEIYSGTGVTKPGIRPELQNRLCTASKRNLFNLYLAATQSVSSPFIFKFLQSPKAHGKATHSANQTHGAQNCHLSPRNV